MTISPIKQALLRATACHCGLDCTHGHTETVKEVAKLDRQCLGHLGGDTGEATLFYAANLYRFGLPFDFAILDKEILPEMCAHYTAPL
jgi:hypothetical protein